MPAFIKDTLFRMKKKKLASVNPALQLQAFIQCTVSEDWLSEAAAGQIQSGAIATVQCKCHTAQ